MEAFSDGVFSVASTLLVLEIALRPPGTALEQLLQTWPAYLGYAIPTLAVLLYLALGLFLVVPFQHLRKLLFSNQLLSSAARVGALHVATNPKVTRPSYATPFGP